MINSNGDKIKMEVRNLIPYVYLGAKDYRPSQDREAELVMRVLGLLGNTTSRTIYLDGESGDEMSESDGEVSTSIDGLMNPPRKTKKRKPRRKTTPAAVGEEHDDDDDDDDDGEYEPSIREEGPEHDDRMDNVPGHEEDGDDDDEPDPTAGDDPEIDQDDGDEIGVEIGPQEEEDDEDDIDVGDPEGGVRLSQRGTVKHEARTLEHLLTHRYKNPYCNPCVRAKMKQHKTYRGALVENSPSSETSSPSTLWILARRLSCATTQSRRF